MDIQSEFRIVVFLALLFMPAGVVFLLLDRWAITGRVKVFGYWIIAVWVVAAVYFMFSKIGEVA